MPGLLRRVGGVVANLSLMVASIALTLGGAELLTRWLRPQQLRRPARLYQPLDSVGYGHVPGLELKVNTGEGTVAVITDREGYRVGTAGRVEASTRVLIVGDSFMEAIEVPYEASVAGILQKELPAELGREVAVRNAGVSGHDPSQYRLMTRRGLARERFDVVLVSIYTGNDISEERFDYFPPRDRASPRVRWPRPWSALRFGRTFMLPLMLRAQRYSHLAVLSYNSTELLRIRLGMWEWDFPATLLREHGKSPAWEVTAGICADLAAAAHEQGAAVGFVVLPQYLQMDSGMMVGYARAVGKDPAAVDLDQPDTRLVQALQVRQLEVIDALPALRAAFQSGTNPYGKVDYHFNAEGHAVVARLVEPWLLEALRKRKKG